MLHLNRRCRPCHYRRRSRHSIDIIIGIYIIIVLVSEIPKVIISTINVRIAIDVIVPIGIFTAI